MANNVMVNVKETFEMSVFAEKLANTYRQKGYTVNIMDMNGNVSLLIEKGTTGATNLLGMGESIRANCMLNGNMLNVTFSDIVWTNKIIALVVGWFLCCVPFITGIIGCIRQYSLPQSLENDIKMIASSM